MCRLPVTLGGGMTMEYGSRAGSGSAWKRCSPSHSFIQRAFDGGGLEASGLAKVLGSARRAGGSLTRRRVRCLLVGHGASAVW